MSKWRMQTHQVMLFAIMELNKKKERLCDKAYDLMLSYGNNALETM